VTKKAKKSQT